MKNLFFGLLTIVLLAACSKEDSILQQQEVQEELLIEKSTELPEGLKNEFRDLLPSRKFNSFSEILPGSKKAENEKKDFEIQILGGDPNVDIDEGIAGHCIITRKKDGTHFRIHATGLTGGEEAQVSISLANYTTACELQPFFPINLQFDVLRIGTKEVNPAGILNFEVFLENGDNSGSILPLFPPAFAPSPGITNAQTAHISVFVRSGGQVDQGLATSFLGCAE